MRGGAQREEWVEEPGLFASGPDSAAALKQMAAERLAAHRNRRAAFTAEETERETAMQERIRVRQESERQQSRQGASRVREAVAARYETSPSYREFLAEEAERALEQAQAEAEVAARNARAVAEAQMQLLEELDLWNRPEPGPREEAMRQRRNEARDDLAHALADIALGAQELLAEPALLAVIEAPAVPTVRVGTPETAVAEVAAAGLMVRLYEDLGAPRVEAPGSRRTVFNTDSAHEASELEQLEEEIEFRRAPEFEEHVVATTPIQANIIEFPRQLVAARRARPRLAEGPLRDDFEPEPQLRIFEVEADLLSPQPTADTSSASPEWQGMLLSATVVHEPLPPPSAQSYFHTEPQAAPIHLRLMAVAVDACCLGSAFLGFATVVGLIAGSLLRGLPLPLLAGLAAGVLLLFVVGYQLLFFTLNQATPGMLYARIGMCTFGDGNPTRKALRRRIFATALAACPVGLGLLWMWMDDDRLGWHDRMSRMYPRAY